MTLVDAIGALGGTLTTLCWLPQVVKAVREKDTRSISLPTFVVLSIGLFCWVIYGFGKADPVLIGANLVCLGFVLTVLICKLRYG
jgi:MtN3 and saliva related transmembrane protein